RRANGPAGGGVRRLVRNRARDLRHGPGGRGEGEGGVLRAGPAVRRLGAGDGGQGGAATRQGGRGGCAIPCAAGGRERCAGGDGAAVRVPAAGRNAAGVFRRRGPETARVRAGGATALPSMASPVLT